MIPIETLLKQLQQAGVNYIKGNNAMMLEILTENHKKAADLDMLIQELIVQLPENNLKKLLLECPKEFLNSLKCVKEMMKIIGERVVFTSSLEMSDDFSDLDYEIWSIFENQTISLLAEVMQRSYRDAEKFIKQMSDELPSQAENMFTVYKVNNEPVGVVLPHIEPRTDREGRIFWIGTHPRFKGKGMGKALHTIGLHRLKNDFKAKSYLGITEIENDAMKKIMISNGCIQNQNTLISLEYTADK